jgi:biopolymer transport protein ExbD
MLVTPVIGQREGLTLPPAENTLDRKDDGRVVVVLRRDATAWLGPDRIDTLGELLVQIKGRLQDRAELVVSVEVDESLPYSRIQEVMDVCGQAGALQLVLMTDRRIGLVPGSGSAER